MIIRTPQSPQLNLSRSKFESPLFVDMQAFFEFSFWLTEELLDLEARFQPKASVPKALQNDPGCESHPGEDVAFSAKPKAR